VLLDAELAALLGKWKVLRTTELAALNAELAKAGISAIAVKYARGDTSTFFLARGRRPPGRRRHGKARGEGSGVRVVAADADSWSCLQTFKQVLLLAL
jgi:hypothetical protein